VGKEGVAFTTTVVVALLLHPLSETVTVYIPPALAAMLLITGFCNELVYPLGPDQEYVTPGVAEEAVN